MTDVDEPEPGSGPRWQWAAGAIAVPLAVAIVAGVLFVHLVGSSPAAPGQPAASGHRTGALTMTARLDFRCDMPVEDYVTRALVSLPDGRVTVDHSVTPTRPVDASPGSSYEGGSWLPVPSAWVSADGGSYAYIASTAAGSGWVQSSTLFVHDVAGNADRQLWSGDGSAQMAGWGPGGVYFVRQRIPGSFFKELWAVDPSVEGGAHRVGPNTVPPPAGPGEVAGSSSLQFETGGGVQGQPAAGASEVGPALFPAGALIGGGAAWTTGYGSLAVLAANGAPGVMRVDLKDGSVSTWFTAPAATSVSVATVDQQGHPVLILNSIQKPVRQPGTSTLIMPWPAPPRVLLLTGPNQTVEIASGSDPSFSPYTASADAHGVWFATPGSLRLYRQGKLAKVAEVPASLFALPAQPAAAPSPPSAAPPPPIVEATRPPGVPTGVSLTLAGPCR